MQKEKKDKKKELKDTTSYIRNEGDEPMDLLSRSIAGNIASEYRFFLHIKHPRLVLRDEIGVEVERGEKTDNQVVTPIKLLERGFQDKMPLTSKPINPVNS